MEAAWNTYSSTTVSVKSGWNLPRHWIAELGRRITDYASRHFIIKRHLVIDLRKMDTEHLQIEAQINGQMLHPSQGIAMPFDGNDRDGKNTLVCGKDFLSARNGRQRVRGRH
jgi:hypothetical protein